MGFTPEQIAILAGKLDAKHVKERSQSGRNLSYIEGWHAIAEANRIFGFDSWCRETIYLKEVCRIEFEKNNRTMFKVGYEAKVRVSVYFSNGDTLFREGTGYGQGTMGDLFDAMESAGKEAETDAMKRALMTFGNPFGLALYDKEQANVSHAPAPTLEDARRWLSDSYSLPELKTAWDEVVRAGFATQLEDYKNQRKAEVSQ